MSVLGKLIGFGLRQVVGDTPEKVAEAVQGQFPEHRQALPSALERASERPRSPTPSPVLTRAVQ